MRTLHSGLRVTDVAASLRFYRALGYLEVGTVRGTPLGDLTLLRLPDDEFATLELMQGQPGTGPAHIAIQVESLDAVRASLKAAGFETGEIERPGGDAGPQTSWATDPDGYRYELTQWPAEHPDGLTEADFSQ